MNKRIIIALLFFLISRQLYAAPVAAVSGIAANNERANVIAGILEYHLLETSKKNGFNIIQPDIINRELKKFSCVEEKCVLNFSVDAGINLLFTGSVTDNRSYMIIRLVSYGIDFPFNRRVIITREIKLMLDIPVNSREFSLICEEQAARFISETLKSFQYPVRIVIKNSKHVIDSDVKISGRFTVYSMNSSGTVKPSGEIEISDNQIVSSNNSFTPGESFILQSFRDKSELIDTYYPKRKREIVFDKTSLYDTLFLFAVIPFASATMPVSSPYLGYYMHNDWSGLGLWMVNVTPYLYLEARGFINSPDRLKGKKRDISRNDRAVHMFGWYMLAAGGMPLFIDSYSHNYLHHASYFSEKNLMLGNNATAAMLSLTSNGAGHFYRGNRFWGYFYFHLNNSLLFMTLREFSVPEKYNESTRKYTSGTTDSKRRNWFIAGFALSKAIETVHACVSDDNISSGEIIDEYILPTPYFTLDLNGNPVFGASAFIKF